ncbi:MAG: membrane dipeptidase, partial [Pseudomonadota bacterium]
INSEEAELNDLAGRGNAAVAFPEMRRANVGLCVATLLAGCMKPAAPIGAWNSPAQAWAMTQGQLAWYQAMEDDNQLRQILTGQQLRDHMQAWEEDSDACPIGYILSLEGADSLRTLDDLESNYAMGLRALGPAHYGKGRYALGHDEDGPLSQLGRELLAEMDRLNLILDATHLCEKTFWKALDAFNGPVWASHHNCRALVDDPRQLSDQQIKTLADRNAVIGVACDVWMVVPNWQRRQTTHEDRDDANLNALANHIDHICQLLGDTKHVGIGTDLDGGFGNEQTPSDLKSIADLPKLWDILRSRGYNELDLENIAHKNFIDFLLREWA